MDLQTLGYFRAVVDAGSLSKAAVQLHYAQSNLSTKITQLEKELRCKLFYRTSQGVMPTPKGAALYGYAADMQKLADEALRAMWDDGSDTGSITIGSMESTAASFLPRFLSHFHQAHPAVSVRVDTGTTSACVEKLLEHRLDGAFIAGPIHHPELESIHVREEKLLLFSDPLDKGTELCDILTSRAMLVFPTGCSYRKAFDRLLTKLGLVSKQVFEFSSLSGMLTSVNAGLGAALLPASVIEQAPSGYRFSIHEVPTDIAQIETVFAYGKESYLSGAMRSFMDALGAK